MKIREATRDDAESVSQLASEFHRYLRSLGDPTRFNFNAEAHVRDGFGPNRAFFGLVAEEEEKTVGYLLYHFGYDTDHSRRLMYVIDLYVDLEYRANGIGKALMKRASEEALSQGATDLWWGVYERNTSALKFYESLGAKHIKGVYFMSIKAEALSEKST